MEIPAAGRVVNAVAVHDRAMLARIVSVLTVHPVGSMSYTPVGDRAVVRLQVFGGVGQETRVLNKLRRIVGVLEAGYEAETHSQERRRPGVTPD